MATRAVTTFDRDVQRVVGALLRQHREGVDVGDLLAVACRTAAARLGGDDVLVQNRPGSWEASHVVGLAGGWDY